MKVTCSHCSRTFQVLDQMQGKELPCPFCEQLIDVPVSASATPPVAAAAPPIGGPRTGGPRQPDSKEDLSAEIPARSDDYAIAPPVTGGPRKAPPVSSSAPPDAAPAAPVSDTRTEPAVPAKPLPGGPLTPPRQPDVEQKSEAKPRKSPTTKKRATDSPAAPQESAAAGDPSAPEKPSAWAAWWDWLMERLEAGSPIADRLGKGGVQAGGWFRREIIGITRFYSTRGRALLLRSPLWEAFGLSQMEEMRQIVVPDSERNGETWSVRMPAVCVICGRETQATPQVDTRDVAVVGGTVWMLLAGLLLGLYLWWSYSVWWLLVSLLAAAWIGFHLHKINTVTIQFVRCDDHREHRRYPALYVISHGLLIETGNRKVKRAYERDLDGSGPPAIAVPREPVPDSDDGGGTPVAAEDEDPWGLDGSKSTSTGYPETIPLADEVLPSPVTYDKENQFAPPPRAPEPEPLDHELPGINTDDDPLPPVSSAHRVHEPETRAPAANWTPPAAPAWSASASTPGAVGTGETEVYRLQSPESQGYAVTLPADTSRSTRPETGEQSPKRKTAGKGRAKRSLSRTFLGFGIAWICWTIFWGLAGCGALAVDGWFLGTGEHSQVARHLRPYVPRESYFSKLRPGEDSARHNLGLLRKLPVGVLATLGAVIFGLGLLTTLFVRRRPASVS